MREELSKKSAKLIDDYINGRQELSFPIYQKLRKQLNLCIEELQNLVWYRTCDPSQYDKLAKRLKDYEKMEKEMIKVFRFYKELNGDNNRKEFYKVGTQDEEEPVMKMKLIRVKCKDKEFIRNRKDAEDIFKKEKNQLLDKINKAIKKAGFNLYYTIIDNLYYNKGYRMDLKVHDFPKDRKEKQRFWNFLAIELDQIQTKNLVFKSQFKTGNTNCIYLKNSYDPSSDIEKYKNIGWSSSGT